MLNVLKSIPHAKIKAQCAFIILSTFWNKSTMKAFCCVSMNSNQKGTVFLHIVCLCSPNFGKLQNPNTIWYLSKHLLIPNNQGCGLTRSLIGFPKNFLPDLSLQSLNSRICITEGTIFLETSFFDVFISKVGERSSFPCFSFIFPHQSHQKNTKQKVSKRIHRIKVWGPQAWWHGGEKWSPGQPEGTGTTKKWSEIFNLFEGYPPSN